MEAIKQDKRFQPNNPNGRIKSKNTKPEVLVRKALFKKGFRFRIHDKRLPGKPDIVLPKYRVVIMVNGCFWHGHENCKVYKVPKAHPEWWINKIGRNIDRDTRVVGELTALGWKVLTVWECEIMGKTFDSTIDKLVNGIVPMPVPDT